MDSLFKNFDADKTTSVFDCDITPIVPHVTQTLEKYNKMHCNRAQVLEIFMEVFKITLSSNKYAKKTKTETAYIN